MDRKSNVPERSGKGEGGRMASQAGSTAKDLPVLSFATTGAWSRWLAAHHASSRGVWLKIAKKGASSASITYAQAIDVALAWGWIDGQKGKLDEVWWLQRFTPRTAKSPWSKINRAKAEALIAAGSMEPQGLAEVERAKRDGRWERAYDGARLLECARRPRRRIRAQRSGARLLRDARRCEPLRNPLPRTDGEEAGDASRAHHAIRRHVCTTRDDSSATSHEVRRPLARSFEEGSDQEVGGVCRARLRAARRSIPTVIRDRAEPRPQRCSYPKIRSSNRWVGR